MQLELRQLQKSVGITFVFVTHDQEEALSMSDRIAVMSSGRVLQVASPRVLYEQPNCREVADFIGTINFFDGVVAAREGAIAVVDAGPIGKLRVTSDDAVGAKVLLALRPEKIGLSATQGMVKGTIAAAAYLGERSHYMVMVAGREEPIAVAAQNAEKTADAGHAPGATAYLSWANEAVAVLPRG
jgi:spermidine/putrescine transport system ATP-binding protein/putrescine transport system ATP-binding protein